MEWLVRKKQSYIDRYIPQEYKPKLPVDETNIPRAKLMFKGKCLNHESGGLSCKKDHSHDRELVDCSNEPVRRYLARCSRALRLAWRHGGYPSWTLWNQSKTAYDIYARISHLKVVPQFELICPCGKPKCHRLSLVKIDAAQFLKAASSD